MAESEAMEELSEGQIHQYIDESCKRCVRKEQQYAVYQAGKTVATHMHKEKAEDKPYSLTVIIRMLYE